MITHSRGGLVLRALVEQRDQLNSPSVKVTWGQAVLVAAPNDGTPLATPARWEETVGWFAQSRSSCSRRIRFTTGAEFVSEAIVWLAARVAGDLPGLRSMDGGGDFDRRAAAASRPAREHLLRARVELPPDQ